MGLGAFFNMVDVQSSYTDLVLLQRSCLFCLHMRLNFRVLFLPQNVQRKCPCGYQGCETLLVGCIDKKKGTLVMRAILSMQLFFAALKQICFILDCLSASMARFFYFLFWGPRESLNIHCLWKIMAVVPCVFRC